eukprot:TRINITY_DN9732_c0_g1_i1.p1 TRINITY_DN9732_c0_g1~~TRINITY_DN9732_c0_g1_i1.p1  ORF type:complete len:871 (+),score=150.71 TRINITY_DN9732_c0_g1_i1:25-2637(+)
MLYLLFKIILLLILCTKADITVLTQGDNIISGVKESAVAYEQATGKKVNIVGITQGLLFEEIENDLKFDSPLYDAFIASPQWVPDFVDCETCSDDESWLEPLTDRIKNDQVIDWTDISSFFRAFSSAYKGDIYSLPLDGDIHFLYYRKDILEEYDLEVPQTWSELLDVAQEIHGEDFNGDGVPDSSVCFSFAPDWIYYWIWDIFSAHVQTKGTEHGAFFDPENFDQLIETEAFSITLQIAKDLFQYTDQSAVLNADAPFGFRDQYITGQCALMIDWGDIPGIIHSSNTSLAEVTGVELVPGSQTVWDRETKEMVECNEELCPYAVGGINFAPFSAFGGWVGYISAKISEETKDESYEFLSWLNGPERSSIDVKRGMGFEIYRLSHLDIEKWEDVGYQKDAIQPMLDTLDVILNHQNIVLDLRINGNKFYTIDLGTPIHSYIIDESTLQETLDNCKEDWEELTAQYGTKHQQDIYRFSVGKPPLATNEYIEFSSTTGIVFLSIIGFFVFIQVITAINIWVRREWKIIKASTPAFLMITIFGVILCNVSALFWMGTPSVLFCNMRLWLFIIGFTIAYGAILIKNYRVYSIWRGILTVRDDDFVPLTEFHLIKYLLFALFPIVVVATIWTISNTLEPFSITDSTGSVNILTCSSAYSNIYVLVSSIYFLALLVYGMYLSIYTRKIPSVYKESFIIITSIYGLIPSVIFIAIIPSLGISILIIFLPLISVLFAGNSMFLIHFLPKLYWIFMRAKWARFGSDNKRNREDDPSTRRTGRRTHTKSSQYSTSIIDNAVTTRREARKLVRLLKATKKEHPSWFTESESTESSLTSITSPDGNKFKIINSSSSPSIETREPVYTSNEASTSDESGLDNS